MPGGDDFGSRPIDMHLAGLEAMGATFKFDHGYVERDRRPPARRRRHVRLPERRCHREHPHGGRATPKGTTVIDNAAREPEITDLCRLLVVDGRRHRGDRHVAARRARRRAGHAARRAPRHGARPDPGRHLPRRGGGHRRRARSCAAPAPTTWTMLLRRFTDMGLELGAAARRVERLRARAAAGDRRRDPAVPRASPPTTSR